MSTGSATDVIPPDSVSADLVFSEQLSALADGELDGAAAAAVCAACSVDSSAQASWRVYQLIGDVLRSEDLATDPAHDVAFISALRERLAREPLPSTSPPNRPAAGWLRLVGGIVPSGRRSGRGYSAHPLTHRGRDRQSRGAWLWNASPALAAGFVAIAGVLMLTRSVEPVAPSATALARADGGAPGSSIGNGGSRLVVAAAQPPISSGTVAVADSRQIRDARLDAYLAAHKQFAGSSALGLPIAFLRSATLESPGR